YHLMQALAFERRSLAPITYGGFKRALEELVKYAAQTEHEGKPLSQNSVIRAKLADLAIDLEVLRMFAFQIAWRISQGQIPVYESSRNKIMSDEVMRRVAITGAELLGVYSQVDPDSEWSKLNGTIQGAYLGFPGMAIAAGTAEIEKSIIAQFGLGLPKSY
ncbi:unnamed protein product, partial [marine sediment metagenome]